VTGFGVILDITHGVLLIDGHHLDMIDGDIICTMVGIIMDGDIITGWAMFIMEMAGMDITITTGVGDNK
tara:strand:- start:486 stop:692 length:207 start_codon:yes stop_codon:yes gene_type:complete